MYLKIKSIQNVYSKKTDNVVYLRIDSDKLIDYKNQIEYVTENRALIGDFCRIGDKFVFIDNEFSIVYEIDKNKLIESGRISISNVNIRAEFTTFCSIGFSSEENYSFTILEKSTLACIYKLSMPDEIGYLTQSTDGFYLRKKYGLGIYNVTNDGTLKNFPIKCYLDDGYQDLYFITIHQNQLICTVNQDRILGIDANNGEVLWEVKEMLDQNGNFMKEFYLADFAGVTDGKIIFCSGVVYAEFELSTKTLSVKKNFSPLNDLLSAEFFIMRSSLQHEFMYFTSENKKTKRWHTVGVLDTRTLEIIWSFDLELPKTTVLNNPPLVDESYLYITDSTNALHIFAKL